MNILRIWRNPFEFLGLFYTSLHSVLDIDDNYVSEVAQSKNYLWNFHTTVEPLFYGHFGTKNFACNTEVFLFKYIELDLLGPKFFVLSSEVSLIQGVI